MHKIPFYQVDAFADRPFAGNPAAVCVLDAWLPTETLQAIAMENNLSETAFVVAEDAAAGRYALRWFTPTVEVDLCGHATLAAAYVVTQRLTPGLDRVAFSTLSGELIVSCEADHLTLDFPVAAGEPVGGAGRS